MKDRALDFCRRNHGPHKRITGDDLQLITEYMRSKGAKSTASDVYRLFKGPKAAKMTDMIVQHFEKEYNFITIFKEGKKIGYAEIETETKKETGEEE